MPRAPYYTPRLGGPGYQGRQCAIERGRKSSPWLCRVKLQLGIQDSQTNVLSSPWVRRAGP